MYEACSTGGLEVVKVLVEHKADVHRGRPEKYRLVCDPDMSQGPPRLIFREQDPIRARPPHIAVQTGQVDVVRYLLELKASFTEVRAGWLDAVSLNSTVLRSTCRWLLLQKPTTLPSCDCCWRATSIQTWRP